MAQHQDPNGNQGVLAVFEILLFGESRGSQEISEREVTIQSSYENVTDLFVHASRFHIVFLSFPAWDSFFQCFQEDFLSPFFSTSIILFTPINIVSCIEIYFAAMSE